MQLNRILKCLRIFNHYSQTKLSDEIGLSKSYISEIENEKKKPTLEIIEKYAKIFKIPASTIMLFAEVEMNNTLILKVRKFLTKKALIFFEWLIEYHEEI